jgi:hypothetical protein
MNKDQLLEILETSRETFLTTLEQVSPEYMETPGVVGDWTVKDTVFHMLMWEAELIKLLFRASLGKQPATVHFSGKSTDQINAEWYQAGKDRALERVLNDFLSIRTQTIRRVEAFSNRDLTQPKRFPWLQGYTLASWIESDTTKHEADHGADILAWLEANPIRKDTHD